MFLGKEAILASSAGNLERRAQGAELRTGVVFVALALLLGVVLQIAGAGAMSRLVVFVPLFLGAYGIQAGIMKTCGFCAFAGVRMTDDGPAPVADPEELAVHRRAGVRVIALSAGLAAAGAALLAFAR